MALATGSRLGPYEILAPLGAGGMGEVYRARDPRIGREVAVKVLHQTDSQDPDRLRRFEQEVRAAGSLSHPYILSVFDVGSQGGAPYVVSELLEGETLRARLAAGPLPLRRALEYASQVSQGLAAAHDKGIVHRDLKPENLFVTRDGRVKILDFGLAKLVRLPGVTSGSGASETVDLTPNTEPGVVVGTVGYMSPEQVRGDAADHRSDIFSFGLVLYEMVAGKRAFQGATPVETMHAILKDEPAELPAELPPGVARIVAHCLEKNPADRFQSARDMAFDLQSLSERSVSGLRPAPRLSPRWGRLALGLAALAALAAALGGSYWLGARSAPPELPSYKCLTYRRGTLAAARFTSDGRTIVYSAAWDGRPEELYTSRVDSPEWRLLGYAGAKLLGVSASGELAIMTGERAAEFGTLARVPLVGGTPRQVLENVSAADWSPDGKELAIVREVKGRSRIEYPIGRSVAETDAFVSELRVSPQGDRLAFVEHDALGTSEGSVVIADLSGARQRVSKRYGMIEGLAWRPDGQGAWFTALPEVAASLAIYELPLAGPERVVARGPGDIVLHDLAKGGRALVERDESRFEMRGLPPGAAAEQDLSWLDSSFSADLSADGSLVLFEEYGDGAMGETQTYLRKTDGSPGVRLGQGWALALSPDAKWALTKLESPSRLVLLPTGPGDPRTLPSPPGFTYSIWGAFAPDGRRVLFSAQEQGKGGRWFVQDLAGGAPRPVTPEGVETVAVLSPDGRYLACDGDTTLYPVDAGEPRTIPGLTSQDRPAGFSPDGRFLYVMTRNVVPAAVHRVEVASGRRELWKELKPPDPAGVSFLYRVHIARDGRSYVYSHPRDLSVLYLGEGLQ